jgi:transposase
MAAAGQSTRHIARVLGIGKSTAAREVQALNEERPKTSVSAYTHSPAQESGSAEYPAAL